MGVTNYLLTGMLLQVPTTKWINMVFLYQMMINPSYKKGWFLNQPLEIVAKDFRCWEVTGVAIKYLQYSPNVSSMQGTLVVFGMFPASIRWACKNL